MNSPHVGALLSAYLDGDTTPAEHALVERHLATCPECQRVLLQYRDMGGQIRELSRPLPPLNLHRDVWTAIEARDSRAAWGAPLAGLLRIGAIAAVLILAVFLVKQFWPARPEPQVAASMLVPRPDQPNVGINTVIDIRFTKPVAEGILAEDVVRVAPDVPWEAQFGDSDRRQLLVQPPKGGVATWPANTAFAVTVMTGTRFTDNSVLAHGLTWRFTTANFLNSPTPTPTNTATPTNSPTPIPPSPTVVPPPTLSPVPTLPPPTLPIVTAVAQNPTAPPVVVPPTQPPVQVSPVVTAVATLAATVPPVPAATDTVPPGPATVTPRAVPSATRTSTSTPTAGPSGTATPGVASPTPTRTYVPVISTAISSVTPPSGTSTPTPACAGCDPPPATATMSSGGTPSATAGRAATPRPTATSGGPPAVACRFAVQGAFDAVYSGAVAVRNALGCAVGAESAVAAPVGEPFEHGLMFWNGDGRLIYVLDANELVWFSYPDTWREGDPQGGTEPAPPGLYAPVRGFGKVWREQANVRTRLGWADAPEAPVTASLQAFERGSMLQLEPGFVRILYTNGTWELRHVP